VVLLVQPLVEHGLVLAQSQQTLLMEMISVLQVIDMILWYYRAPKNAVAARETLYTTHSQSVSQLHRGPPALTTPASQRTAPLPSVNTSTEYSLSRATQFR